MGASWPGDDDFDAERADMESHYDGADPFIETDHDPPLPASAPKASDTAQEKPKRDESKARINVDDSHSKKRDVESGAAVAAPGKTKGKPRGRPPLHLVDPKKAEEGDGRTVIHLDPDQLHTSVELVLITLGRTGKVFLRGHVPVEVRGFVSDSEKKEGPIAEGSPIVMQIRSPAMAVTMAEYCLFRQKKVVDENVRECRVLPPDTLATKVCETASRGNRISAIQGVLECPSMRPDGTLILKNNYDASTGYFLASNLVLPPIPDRPTLEDAKRALAKLQHLFSPGTAEKYGFFWANGLKDTIVPIAALCALVARPAITWPQGGVPAFVFRGTTPGTQKGTVIDMICLIVTGRTAPTSSWPTEKDEQEKEIGAIAMAGAPIAFWDEVQEVPGRVLVNGRLHTALTTDQTAFRVLGFSQMPILPWRTVAFFAGNNFMLDPNMARRSVCVNLESPVEKPATLDPSEFVHEDPKGEALKNRAEYIAAVLTILRAFQIAGAPKQGVTIGSFPKFARIVGDALAWVGAGNIADYVDSDPETETTAQTAIRVIVREWARLPDVAAGKGCTIAGALSLLYSDERIKKLKNHDEIAPDGWDELRNALESLAPLRPGMMKPDSDPIGKVIRDCSRVWFGDVRFVSLKNPGTGKPYSPAKWGVEKKVQPIEGTQVAAEQAPTVNAPTATEHNGTPTSGPNGCPLSLACECSPCRRCGLCNWTRGDLGGCICCVD